jgi:hypothetical protein
MQVCGGQCEGVEDLDLGAVTECKSRPEQDIAHCITDGSSERGRHRDVDDLLHQVLLTGTGGEFDQRVPTLVHDRD